MEARRQMMRRIVQCSRGPVSRGSSGRGADDFSRSIYGQAYTEYVIILAVLMALGIGAASIFTGSVALQDIFYDYYASLANYLNLPFF